MIVLSLALSLFAGGAAEEKSTANDEKTVLTFWSEFTTPERTEYVERMANLYMQSHPDVTIEVTPLPDKAANKVLTAYEAGQGPDVFQSSGPDITNQINGDYIISLDEYFDSWEGNDLILPSAIETVRSFDITGNGKLYYIPNGISVTTLWVRSDWLREAGFADGIKTWEDFFSAAEKMTDKDKRRYGLAIRGGSGGAKFLDRQMYAYSGILSVFDENGKCTINDPKNIEFVERYFGLYGKATSDGDLGYGWTELSAAFDSGSAGMIIHNLGSAADHEKAFGGDRSKFAGIGMPLNGKGTSVNLMLQPGGMTISKTCKNPDVAFDFIAFMSTGDAVDEYCRLYGVVPVEKNVLESSAWIKELPWYANAAALLLDENTLFYNSYAWLPGRNKIYTEMDTESQLVMTGQMTAKEMLDNWASLYQQKYDEFMAARK